MEPSDDEGHGNDGEPLFSIVESVIEEKKEEENVEVAEDDRYADKPVNEKEGVDEPVERHPISLTLPSRRRLRLMPLEEKKKEDITKICGICKEAVNKRASWVLRAPCCGALYHAECMVGSIFLPSRKHFFCARCVEPRPPMVTTLYQKKQQARKRYLENLDIVQVENRTTHLTLLKEHLLQSIRAHIVIKYGAHGIRGTSSSSTYEKSSKWKKSTRQRPTKTSQTIEKDEEIVSRIRKAHKQFLDKWDRWISVSIHDPYKLEFLMTQKPAVIYGTLVSLGWKLEDIYLNITTTWNGLYRLGFTTKHLADSQKNIDALVSLFDVDVDRIRQYYGYHAISIRKVKTLQAETLSLLGFSAHFLCTVCRMKKTHIPEFETLLMNDWVHFLELRPVHIKLLRIKHEDFGRLLKTRHWYPDILAGLMSPYLSMGKATQSLVDESQSTSELSTDIKDKEKSPQLSRSKRRAYRRKITKAEFAKTASSERTNGAQRPRQPRNYHIKGKGKGLARKEDDEYFENVVLSPAESRHKKGPKKGGMHSKQTPTEKTRSAIETQPEVERYKHNVPTHPFAHEHAMGPRRHGYVPRSQPPAQVHSHIATAVTPQTYAYQVPVHHRGTTYYPSVPPTATNTNITPLYPVLISNNTSTFRYNSETSTGFWTQPPTRMCADNRTLKRQTYRKMRYGGRGRPYNRTSGDKGRDRIIVKQRNIRENARSSVKSSPNSQQNRREEKGKEPLE